MSTRRQLKRSLAELGLEDEIPLPEALEDLGPLAKEFSDQPWLALSEALIDLLDEGQIAVYKGRRGVDPEALESVAAKAVLREEKWFIYHLDDPAEERVYFENVENLAGPKTP